MHISNKLSVLCSLFIKANFKLSFLWLVSLLGPLQDLASPISVLHGNHVHCVPAKGSYWTPLAFDCSQPLSHFSVTRSWLSIRTFLITLFVVVVVQNLIIAHHPSPLSGSDKPSESSLLSGPHKSPFRLRKALRKLPMSRPHRSPLLSHFVSFWSALFPCRI